MKLHTIAKCIPANSFIKYQQELDEEVDFYLLQESLEDRKLVDIQYIIYANVLYAKIITKD